MRDEYTALNNALTDAAVARGCIADNTGHERVEAGEAYDACVTDEVAPALLAALNVAFGDLDSRDIERLAEAVYKRLLKSAT